MIPFRLHWDNLSDDICYIGPDAEEQENAGEFEKGRQMKESEKNPVEKRAHISPANCAKVCEADGLDIPEDEFNDLENDVDRGHLIRELYQEKVDADASGDFRRSRKCFQWRYNQGACCTSRSFKLGKPRHEPDEGKWSSGWFVRGINDWVQERGECTEVEWRTPF